MNVFAPYTHLEFATRRALYGTGYKAVLLDDSEAYWRFFKDRWKDAQTFISVEHDVVPWPGALEALDSCPKLWCSHGYMPYDDLESDSYTPFLGCVKFSGFLLKRYPDLWDAAPSRHWMHLDGHLATYLRERGENVHQHHPSVLNIGAGFKLHHRNEG